MLELLGMSIQISETKAYHTDYTDILDWRNKESSDNKSMPLPPYRQVFEEKFGFIGGLSILDLLFCLGPESTIWLKKISTIPYD